MTDLQQESAELLQRLVRFRTVNPPGAERECQEHLGAILRDAGFEVELLGRTEERPNLVARLRGAEDGPRLVLLSHVDTVLAEPDDWQRDPWSGEIVSGELWGRGSQDMKSQTAAEAIAVVSLAREGWRPARGELIVVATVAEKGVFRFTLTTRGAAGHASMPGVGDNALLKMAPLLQAMAERRPGLDVTDAPRSLLRALDLDSDGDPAAALEELRDRDPALAGFVEPMMS